MNHLGHMIVGLIVALIVMIVFGSFSFSLAGIALLGAILPDIDLKQSKASQIVEPIAIIGLTLFLHGFFSSYSLLVSWVASLVVSLIATYIVLKILRRKHRGITHSFGAAILFSAFGLLTLGIIGGLVGLVSYGSHLVVDRL